MSGFVLKLFCKDKTRPTAMERTKVGTLCSIIGIICNLFLALGKIVVGYIGGSLSISADGFNNLTDMASSLVTLVGFKIAAKPADKDHPFGHGRIEDVSAFIVSLLILLVGFELAKSSVTALIAGDSAPVYGTLAIVVLALSAVVKFLMYLFNISIGKAIESEALTASAKDSLNDVAATGAVLISVVVCLVAEVSFNLDAVMGLLVSLFILWAGINTAKDTLNKILGEPPSPELIDDIKDAVLSFSDFDDIHDLIVHNYGPGRILASVHVEVDHKINIVHCHESVDNCEKLIAEKLGVEITIHVDPMDNDNAFRTEIQNKMREKLIEIDSRLTLHDFRMTARGETRTNLVFDVVKPLELKMTDDELKSEIDKKAKEMDVSFYTAVTVDNDYCARS